MNSDLVNLILTGTKETLYMVFLSSIIAFLLGIPIGILLVVSDKGGIFPLLKVNKIVGFIINVIRSMPEMILIIILLPLAKLIVGTTLGANAAIVSISIGSAPFIARIIENSLKEVEFGKIEAAEAMGATTFEIIKKVLLPEALPSIVRGATIAIIGIIGFTAIAGAIGAGGLGSLAIRFGYQRFRTDVLIGTVIVLVTIVQVIQLIGDSSARLINKKRFKFD
ncbi:methionine ABC transporter permease [Clostridium saccharoperbutylacetonicum]|uniref:Putative D-methionine transport system permease protein MetI n=1 Tax=Clostridium saccharoperbutylacetonicum N1-4(HMT) TaxID=931276 RepID=M1MFP8_9CLOT|nr:methionine ABC transporter permease [Clostridium saccharoperbutylacetonicum]AGF55198.1 putative D-methionine transport system permease protein MetI [Clostridium saccharoperbutylacetonicum N1-4(HMT)]AQR94087.1 methionine import system permease protein MetP [Clostridium saccharoperbutylacetonicum]NRT64091.1 D-methionine transport system permease protein [Clostridium saccharoperbutylacetonicum]NSB27458.1 D-methionine transport system permease protein [Clostridium saccharoperbutylacetonicum]NSB